MGGHTRRTNRARGAPGMVRSFFTIYFKGAPLGAPGGTPGAGLTQ
jgi:hypothetical protein